MPRQNTGSVRLRHGTWYARVTLSAKERPSIPLPTRATEKQALKRLAVLAALAAKLRRAGHASLAADFLTRAAARESDALDAVCRAVDKLCSSVVIVDRPLATGKPWAPDTFGHLAERWTSGELAQQYRDHVKAKKSATADVSRLDTHILPVVGDVPLASFTLEHAEQVMRKSPSDLGVATCRHVAQILNRLLNIAAYPLKLIPANPLPEGFLPKLEAPKAKTYLYPDEDMRLLGCPDIPLAWRVFYGFLHREGTRRSEAARLTCGDVDLSRGAIRLDENKTNDPRAWALSPGVVAALQAWCSIRGELSPSWPIFVDEHGEPLAAGERHFAAMFRKHLAMVGIDRQGSPFACTTRGRHSSRLRWQTADPKHGCRIARGTNQAS